jgi:fimbrial chaperone protein
MASGKPLVFVTALLTLVGGAVPALAGTFQVTPTRIDLSARDRTAVLTLRNTGSEALRFQLRAYQWKQRDDGEMLLTATEDVVVYPTLISLRGGAARSIRVGVVAPPGTLEKSYRVFVEELPRLSRAREGVVGVRVLTRMGIPVFLAPRTATTEMKVTGLSVRQGRLSFAVNNPGTAHVRVGRVHVEARSADGALALHRELPGWYVLAGRRLTFEVELPPDECRRLTEVRVRAVANARESARALRFDAASCER